jgi:hypothetical protein
MQECLICKALLLEKLVLKISLIASAVVVVVVVVVFPVALVVLACVLTPFILCKVHREVLGCLSTCEVTCRKELRTCSLAFFVCVFG